MKKLSFLLALALLIMGGKSKGQSTLNMKGAYRLIQQIGNDGTKDSVLKKAQFKIYTDRHMIYASPRATDSLAIYGIGTYKAGNGKVTEYVFHTSAEGATKDTIVLNITRSDTGYTQVIDFRDSLNRKYTLTETYKSVGRPVTSPLDGAWRQTQNMFVPKNGDTLRYNITQFKVYESGHFIWANTYRDTATKEDISSFGYGTFEMQGDNQSREINNNSTFITDLVGVPVRIQLEFTGKDVYKQTITNPNGDKSIEVYRRIK